MSKKSQKYIKAAVLGFPIKHSKSPLIHNYWIKKYGLSGVYDAREIHPELFNKERLLELAGEGYSGFNLTLPHKEYALDHCDEMDDLARTIGAVNTISVEKGRIMGTNTDAFGFIQSLKEHCPDYDVKQAPVLVLGAGGAAKAAVYGLLKEGAPKIRLCNRARGRAEDLAVQCLDPARIEVFDWDRRNIAAGETGLVVNATSLGMKRDSPLLMDFRQCRPGAVAYDMVYKPLKTRFLLDAKKAGLTPVSGIHMLLHQARPAFKLWFGVLPDVDETLEALVTSSPKAK
jgi:shikimate dehydrogenase